MNKPLLSICIPTFNKVSYLKECLDSIVCQSDNKEIFSKTEIVISDNASRDNTQELVREYQKRFHNIRYFRNKKNLGFDRNVDNTITLASGDFCWTLADDEEIKKEELKFLLETIKKHQEIAYIGMERLKNDDKIEYFKNGNEILKTGNLPPGGYLSFNIFNKKFLPPNHERYYDNFWLHYSLVMEIIAKNPFIIIKNILKNKETFDYSWKKEGKKGHCFTTYRYLKKIIQDLPLFGYEKKGVNKILNGFARGLPKTVASAKIYGLETSWENFVLLVKDFYHYPLWLFLSTIVFLIPTPIFKFFKKIKTKFF